jgi:hypothetical protein
VVHAAALALGIPEHRARRLSRLAPRPFDSGPRLVGPPPCLRDLDGALRVALPEWFGTRLERMAEFTLCIASRNGTVPQIGDNDSGRLFKLPGTYRVTTAAEARRRYRTLEGWNELADEEACPEEQGLDHRHLVGAVNGLVPRADFASFARGFELDAWLVRALAGRTLSPRGAAERAHGAIGEAAAVERTLAEIRGLPGTHRQTYRFAGSHLRQRLETFAYPAFGLYVWCSPTLHLVVRCGPSGPKVQGAHAHNDALGITLAIGGRELVADPGSYVYTPLPNARNRYRSAAAHFVPRVAGREPAPLDRGLFVLPDTPGATCIRFGPEGFAGAHSGFGPPVLRVIRIEEDSVTIEDGSLGEPLERCEAPAPVAVSDKYGWLRR